MSSVLSINYCNVVSMKGKLFNNSFSSSISFSSFRLLGQSDRKKRKKKALLKMLEVLRKHMKKTL